MMDTDWLRLLAHRPFAIVLLRVAADRGDVRTSSARVRLELRQLYVIGLLTEPETGSQGETIARPTALTLEALRALDDAEK